MIMLDLNILSFFIFFSAIIFFTLSLYITNLHYLQVKRRESLIRTVVTAGWSMIRKVQGFHLMLCKKNSLGTKVIGGNLFQMVSLEPETFIWHLFYNLNFHQKIFNHWLFILKYLFQMVYIDYYMKKLMKVKCLLFSSFHQMRLQEC